MLPDEPLSAEDRVFERQRRVRFTDLDEFFFARILLGLAERPGNDHRAVVELTLDRLFPIYRTPTEAEGAATVLLDISDRMTEQLADVLSALSGRDLEPESTRTYALDHYVRVLRSRLSHLRDADGLAVPASIESYREVAPGRFHITFNTGQLRASIAANLEKRLTLSANFVATTRSRLPGLGFRIAFRKELELLNQFLDARQATTGEVDFEFTSRTMPFRHAITTLTDGVAIPASGTCGPADRALLPIYLEVSGLLDITHVGIVSSPTNPEDIDVKFAVRRPARTNIFGAPHQGLTAEARCRLSDVELSVYDRIHRYLQNRYVFAGRPMVEASFGSLAAWLIRRVCYCLEEPSFLRNPASRWLAEHSDDRVKRMEDDFFLPALHERLHQDFGARVLKVFV